MTQPLCHGPNCGSAVLYLELLAGGINDFSEKKHFVFFAPVARFLLGYSRTMEMLVPKLHNLETTTVDVEMNVAFLKIGRDGFPNFGFRIQ